MAMTALHKFYLVGGTALALQLGHRFSIDLDLFSTDSFDSTTLFGLLSEHFDEVTLESEEPSMLITTISQVKVDFVKMGYPILFPSLEIDGIRMLDLRDIAPMKLKAIAQRGSKKDFFDMYYLIEILPLQEIIRLFSEKFRQQEIFHVIKSLVYFEDAEGYADPIVFDHQVSWPIVKAKMLESVRHLG
jgi:predicted nucleotidyltransferase component of viral defense system